MLNHYLNLAIEDIKSLIDLTKEDVGDIKEANHTPQFQRVKIKEELLSSFVNRKSIIDNELVKIVQNNRERNLEMALDSETKNLLADLRDYLEELKVENRKYAKMVLAVGEFYNSLLERVVPTENDGYKRGTKANSFLQVRA